MHAFQIGTALRAARAETLIFRAQSPCKNVGHEQCFFEKSRHARSSTGGVSPGAALLYCTFTHLPTIEKWLPLTTIWAPQGVVVPDDGLGPRGVVVPDDDDLLSCDSDMLEQGLPSRLRVRDDGFSSDDNLGPRGLCDAPSTKRRGRPPKLGAQLVAAPEQPAPPETCDLNLLAWFRPHSDVLESFVTCLTHPYRKAACVENVARVMDHLFGERRRVIGCALSLEAVALGINEKSLPDYVLEAQATSYIGLVLAVESFCDYVGGCIADGSCSPIAA